MVRINDANKWFAKDILSPKDTTIKEAYKTGFLRGMTKMHMRPPQGNWIPSDIPGEEYVCSRCGGACWYYDYRGTLGQSRYCPNCGAKMEG